MSLLRPITARTRRAAFAVATTAAAGSVIAGLTGAGTAFAAAPHAVQPAGFSTVASCTGVSGSLSYSPGLLKLKARNTTAVLSATTSGCSDAFTGPMNGTGTISAILSGKVKLNAENFTGSFTVNWPGGFYNPSNGTLSVTSIGNQQYSVSGTVTSGYDTGSVLHLGYLTTTNTGTGSKAHPVVAQQFVNTSALTLARNFG